MNELKGQLVRITTSDGLELHGIFYEPTQKTNKVVVHIHGWTGNFYENVFIDYIADACLKNGYSFLSFNTRGAGFVREFLKKQNNTIKYIKIGGSLEHFEESIIDIQAALHFLKKKDYHDFILEGHSTGCQKAAYYTFKTQDPLIKGLIFLEPADDPSIVKKFMGDRYREAMEIARRLIANKKPDHPMPDWVPFGVQLSAQKFLSIAEPTSVEGRILYVPGDFQDMKKLICPLLAISASDSEYQDAHVMQKKLKETMKNLQTHIIPHSGHWFFGHEEKVGKIISKWLYAR